MKWGVTDFKCASGNHWPPLATALFRMNIQSCYFCGIVVILIVFKTGINTVSFLACFLSGVLGVFNSPVPTPAHGILGLGIARVFICDLYWRTRACLLCIFLPPSTVPVHFTKLLTRALFVVGLVTVHIFS